MGYNTLLSEHAFGPLNAEQMDTVQRVANSTQDLLELITTTLDLSRLQAGRVHLEPRHFDVAALLIELDAEARQVPRKKNVRVIWKVARDLPRLYTDPLKLKVVLKNLISNALKFTDRGSVTIDASAADGRVCLSVVDTGMGIPPEALQMIFEPFRQLHATSNRSRGGVGLGLHIARRLLDMLGGTIQVESQLGRGSSFRVWIPVEPRPEQS